MFSTTVALPLVAAKTIVKVTDGQDPSITEAFLLAIGAMSALPIPSGLLALEAAKTVPAKPQLDWGALNPSQISEVEPDILPLETKEALNEPLSLLPGSPIGAEIEAKLTPSFKEQLGNGEEDIVLSSKITDAHQRVENGRNIVSLTVEQEIADAGELRLKNILSLISDVNKGKEIAVSDVFIAVVKDLFEQPLEILKHITRPDQIYAASRGTRTVQVDIITLPDYQGQEELERSVIPHTDIEKTGWLTAKKTVTTENTTVEHSTHVKWTAVRFTVVPAHQAEGLYDQLSPDRPKPEKDSFTLLFMEKNQQITESSWEESSESKVVLRADIGGFLGQNKSTSSINKTVHQTPSLEIYRLDNPDALKTGDYDELESIINSPQSLRLEKKTGETIVKRNIDDSSAKREFKSGWIDYAPLGSIVSAGMKSSYGYDLSAMDYFWAIADGALTVGTLGVGSAIKTGAVAVGKAAAQGSAKAALKEAGKAGVKVAQAAGKNLATDIKTPFLAAKDGAAYTIKHGPVKATQEGGRLIAGRGEMVINKMTGNRVDLDKIPGLKHGHQPNADLAGKTIELAPELRSKYPNGVRYDANGHPDFSPYAKVTVPIEMTGNRAHDYAKANIAAGYTKTQKHTGYIWHHHQNGRDMMLVPGEIHKAAKHSGGVSLLNSQTSMVDQMGRQTARAADVALKQAENRISNPSE